MKRSIIITGAASGIGRETALLFAKNDWFVGLFDVDKIGLKSLEKEITSSSCFSIPVDITDISSVDKAIQSFLLKTGGKLDVLFNCAGVLDMGLFEEIEAVDHFKTVQVNLLGSINCIHASLDALKATPNARIINMSSASSIYGTPELATYSATKHAIKGLTEALNLELESADVFVSDIIVPYVNTPLLKKDRKAGSIKSLGVNIEAKEVAQLVLKATKKKKIHWSMNLNLLLIVCYLFPFLKRPIMKHVAKLN